MNHKKIGSKHGIHCAGCRYSFESYGMVSADGYTQDGKIYCSSDCQLEAEVDDIERGEWDSLSAEF